MLFERLERVNDDAAFRIAARFWSATLCLDAGDERCVVKIDNSRVTATDEPHTIRLSGPHDGWTKLLSHTPPPFYQGAWGAVVHHGFVIEGDFENWCQYYPAVSRLIEVLRA